MKFNYSLLKGRIKQCGMTQAAFAKAMKMGRTSLNLRLNNKAEFTHTDIEKSCDILGIPKEDIPTYFFCTIGSETRTN